jgi:hypothetical protein
MSAASLFNTPPTVEFTHEADFCHPCHTPLKVQKTLKRKVITMHVGQFIALETVKQCKKCGKQYRSEELCNIVPPGANFGFDVLVSIGRSLFLKHRNIEETIEHLKDRNIDISPREVSFLGKKFIVYLATAHKQCSQQIKEAMQLKGGYVFHLDGTCEGEEPILMSGLDSLTEIVLSSIKIPSENAEHIIPFLNKIKKNYGTPVALVHDMGKGILKAVEKVFPTTPDFICHFHFLRDIGKDLLLAEYNTIRKCLKQYGIFSKLRYHLKQLKRHLDDNPELIDIFHDVFQEKMLSGVSLEKIPILNTYSLILWTLEGMKEGEGYGFPFDRPHLSFAKRLRIMFDHIDCFKEIELRQNWRDNKPYYRLFHKIKTIMKNKELWNAVDAIESKIQVFEKLRAAMRIAPVKGRKGLNHNGMDAKIKTIEYGVIIFRNWLVKKNEKDDKREYKKMISQIDKYWEKLFSDPITVNTPSCTVEIQPQRTNNILEQFFRGFKRGHRRKTGKTSLGPVFRAMLAETPLVKNLENAQYMEMLLGGQSNLEEVFAKIEITKIRKQLQDAQLVANRVPAKIKRIISQTEYPEKIAELIKKAS